LSPTLIALALLREFSATTRSTQSGTVIAVGFTRSQIALRVSPERTSTSPTPPVAAVAAGGVVPAAGVVPAGRVATGVPPARAWVGKAPPGVVPGARVLPGGGVVKVRAAACVGVTTTGLRALSPELLLGWTKSQIERQAPISSANSEPR
jgi:hypothetical protein